MKSLRSDIDLSTAIRSLAQLLFTLSIMSIAWGFFGFFRLDFLNTGFSLALIALGIATLYIRIPAMLLIYSVALFWLAIQNALEVSTASLGYAFLEFVAGIALLNRFRIYSHIQEDQVLDYFHLDPNSPRLIPAMAKFPLLSALMGGAAIVELTIFIVVGAAIAQASIAQPFEQIVQAIMNYVNIVYLVEPFSVFAFALGLSSRIVGQPPRLLGAIGIFLGGGLMTADVAMLILYQLVLA